MGNSCLTCQFMGAGDFVGIDSNTNMLGVYTALGYQRFTVSGFDNPTDVFPSFNGCARSSII